MSNYNQTPVYWLTFLESVFLESSLLLTQIWIETFSSAVFFFRVLFTNFLSIVCLSLLVDSLFCESPVFPFVIDLACVHWNKGEFYSHHAPVPLQDVQSALPQETSAPGLEDRRETDTPACVTPSYFCQMVPHWPCIHSTLHHRRLSSSQISPQVCSQDLNISAGYPMFCLYWVLTCSAENRCGSWQTLSCVFLASLLPNDDSCTSSFVLDVLFLALSNSPSQLYWLTYSNCRLHTSFSTSCQKLLGTTFIVNWLFIKTFLIF